MSVRAKFWVSEKRPAVTANSEQEAVTVVLTAVYNGSEENKEYWRLTPSGTIQLFTINADAAEQFEIGKQYYVDLTKAD